MTRRKTKSACGLLCLAVGFVDATIGDRAQAATPHQKRFIYNSDGGNMFIDKDTPMKPEDLYSYVDEVADNSVTTYFICPNYGMPVIYPSRVTETFGDSLSAAQWKHVKRVGPQADRKGTMERSLANIRSLLDGGHDPVRVVVDRAHEKGLEVFITYRLNEIHDVQNENSQLVTKFWRDHPQWRVGKHGDEMSPLFKEIIGGRPEYKVSPIVATWFPGALNFAVPEVRTQRLAELRECCERYPVEGLDLDFQRFPIYFPQDKGRENIETMTAWMRKVRAMTRAVGKKRGRPLLLSARVLAKPEQNLAIGLDPFTWAKEGLLDFVVVSHYLRNDFPLPVAAFRKRISNIPIYGSIEVEQNADAFRRIARRLYADGADGILLFNFFAWRENGREPNFKLLKELADPARIQPGNP